MNYCSVYFQIFPLIYSQMDKQEILYCRVVCKGWKKSVDNFLQTHPGTRALEPYPYQHAPHAPSFLPSLIQKGFVGHNFGTSLSVEVFLKEMESQPWNPFITGYLDLSTCPVPEPFPKLQWNDVNSLLTQFGKHILQVNLGPKLFDNDRYTIFDCYKLLEKTLELMPNLKKLFISGFKYYDCSRPIIRFDELVQYIKTHPLPELPQLEALEFAIELRRKTEPVIDELMSRYANRINSISFSLSVWNENKEQYKNLQNLREMKVVVDNYYPLCVYLFKSLNAPQLGKIQMTLQQDGLIIPIMMALHEFCPSLAYLKLKFGKKPRDTYDSFSKPLFQLKGVKTLELVESSNVPYEMLLSYVPSLEYLLILCEPKNEKDESSWELEEMQEEQPTLGIRQHILSQDIYQSNIWTKMGTLKECTLARVNKDEEIVGKTQFTKGSYIYFKQKQINK